MPMHWLGLRYWIPQQSDQEPVNQKEKKQPELQLKGTIRKVKLEFFGAGEAASAIVSIL